MSGVSSAWTPSLTFTAGGKVDVERQDGVEVQVGPSGQTLQLPHIERHLPPHQDLRPLQDPLPGLAPVEGQELLLNVAGGLYVGPDLILHGPTDLDITVDTPGKCLV